MKTIEESVLSAMDCTDKEILPYLPYILQDFWAIGSDPDVMIQLVKKHMSALNGLKVLDLGCGKGIISIHMAKELNCHCHGIDAIPEFISYSVLKSREYGVSDMCMFEVGDIREKVIHLGKYDVIVLGGIGQVFGNYFDTLMLLQNNLNEGGIILIDDGYIKDDCSFKHEHVLSKGDLYRQIEESGMVLIDEVIASEDPLTEEHYDTEYENLLKRCLELSATYPDKADIFMCYSNQQKNEYEHMKHAMTCSTMVVKKKESS